MGIWNFSKCQSLQKVLSQFLMCSSQSYQKKGTELKIATHIESISPLFAIFTVAILSFNTFYGNFYLNQQKLA